MAKGENGKAPARTEYVVLKAFATEEVEGGLAWAPIREKDGAVKVFAAQSRDAAIRQHTGDGADVVEGLWKAVPHSSWRGGVKTVRITAAERLPLEEAIGCQT